MIFAITGVFCASAFCLTMNAWTAGTADTQIMNESCLAYYRYRYSSWCDHWKILFHRSWYWRGYWRNRCYWRACQIYQGVTLGALSTRGGQESSGVRRHPCLEDEVTVYSGASILGGETVVGKGVVIGSNVFITKSVPEGTKVSIKVRNWFC